MWRWRMRLCWAAAWGSWRRRRGSAVSAACVCVAARRRRRVTFKAPRMSEFLPPTSTPVKCTSLPDLDSAGSYRPTLQQPTGQAAAAPPAAGAVAAALRAYEAERSRRCLPLTVRSNLMGQALQVRVDMGYGLQSVGLVRAIVPLLFGLSPGSAVAAGHRDGVSITYMSSTQPVRAIVLRSRSCFSCACNLCVRHPPAHLRQPAPNHVPPAHLPAPPLPSICTPCRSRWPRWWRCATPLSRPPFSPDISSTTPHTTAVACSSSSSAGSSWFWFCRRTMWMVRVARPQAGCALSPGPVRTVLGWTLVLIA